MWIKGWCRALPPRLPPYCSHSPTNAAMGVAGHSKTEVFYRATSSCQMCNKPLNRISIDFHPRSTILLFGSGRGGQEIPSYVSSTGFETIYLFASPTPTGFKGAKFVLWPDLPSWCYDRWNNQLEKSWLWLPTRVHSWSISCPFFTAPVLKIIKSQ